MAQLKLTLHSSGPENGETKVLNADQPGLRQIWDLLQNGRNTKLTLHKSGGMSVDYELESS